MTAAGVRISRLGVEFDTRAGVASALRDVDLDIGPGRILGLVGESGSGKSTAALALLGLLAANARVSSGSLSVDADRYDLTVPGATMPLRGRRIAMIFQDPFGSLNPVFPIRAHLDEVLNLAEAVGAGNCAGARWWRPWRPSASTSRSCGCGSIRMNSPAACASAWRSPWRCWPDRAC